jgi:hypothetical protein
MPFGPLASTVAAIEFGFAWFALIRQQQANFLRYHRSLLETQPHEGESAPSGYDNVIAFRRRRAGRHAVIELH